MRRESLEFMAFTSDQPRGFFTGVSPFIENITYVCIVASACGPFCLKGLEGIFNLSKDPFESAT